MAYYDQFLPPQAYEALGTFARGPAQYSSIVNPADGVAYPDICLDLPPAIRDAVATELSGIMYRPVTPNYLFLRLSVKGQHVPHKVHTDNSMGTYSLMLYLNDNQEAGTGFAKHRKMGIARAPAREEDVATSIRDQNDMSKWEVYRMVPMAQNRALVFDADLFHVALPVGGFGKDKTDGRLVLTAFFD